MSNIKTVACQDDGGVFLDFKSSVTVTLLPDGKNVSVKVVDKTAKAAVEMDATLFSGMCESYLETIKPQIGKLA